MPPSPPVSTHVCFPARSSLHISPRALSSVHPRTSCGQDPPAHHHCRCIDSNSINLHKFQSIQAAECVPVRVRVDCSCAESERLQSACHRCHRCEPLRLSCRREEAGPAPRGRAPRLPGRPVARYQRQCRTTARCKLHDLNLSWTPAAA
jgi:hypothetical protein